MGVTPLNVRAYLAWASKRFYRVLGGANTAYWHRSWAQSPLRFTGACGRCLLRGTRLLGAVGKFTSLIPLTLGGA